MRRFGENGSLAQKKMRQIKY